MALEIHNPQSPAAAIASLPRIFPIWGEENGALTSGAFEYSYGNSDVTTSGFGIVIPVACRLIALSCSLRTGNAVFEARLNLVASGAVVECGGAFPQNNFVIVPPIPYAAGDVLNFRTVAEIVASTDAKPCAWFQLD